MDTFTRRSFLAASAGAAGTAAILAAPGLANAGESDKSRPSDRSGGSGSLGADTIVSVRDAKKGELVIYSGENEFVVTDRNLAAAIARAAGRS
jgi:hypothetical protein